MPSHAQVDGAVRRVEVVRAPPLDEMLRVGPRLPDEFARRCKYALDDELIAGGGVSLGVFAHSQLLPGPGFIAFAPPRVRESPGVTSS